MRGEVTDIVRAHAKDLCKRVAVREVIRETGEFAINIIEALAIDSDSSLRAEGSFH